MREVNTRITVPVICLLNTVSTDAAVIYNPPLTTTYYITAYSSSDISRCSYRSHPPHYLTSLLLSNPPSYELVTLLLLATPTFCPGALPCIAQFAGIRTLGIRPHQGPGAARYRELD
jgi:hypothetical protein